MEIRCRQVNRGGGAARVAPPLRPELPKALCLEDTWARAPCADADTARVGAAGRSPPGSGTGAASSRLVLREHLLCAKAQASNVTRTGSHDSLEAAEVEPPAGGHGASQSRAFASWSQPPQASLWGQAFVTK